MQHATNLSLAVATVGYGHPRTMSVPGALPGQHQDVCLLFLSTRAQLPMHYHGGMLPRLNESSHGKRRSALSGAAGMHARAWPKCTALSNRLSDLPQTRVAKGISLATHI